MDMDKETLYNKLKLKCNCGKTSSIEDWVWEDSWEDRLYISDENTGDMIEEYSYDVKLRCLKCGNSIILFDLDFDTYYDLRDYTYKES